MRKAFASMLALACLALGLAGMAWSGQSPVQTEPQALQAPPAAQEGKPEASLPELYPEPVEVDACRCVECINERSTCWETCTSAQDYWACRAQCGSVYQACMSSC